jgi:hypothetical protein
VGIALGVFHSFAPVMVDGLWAFDKATLKSKTVKGHLQNF